MKSKATNTLHVLLGLVLGLALAATVAHAQQPNASPSPQPSPKAKTQPTPAAGDEEKPYTIISSVEFGYRGLKVDGDLNKYQSDLNYKAGPRLFDSSFLMKSNVKGGLFDTLLVTSTGWGADPNGNMRISAENSDWFRFDGTYRRFKYFRYLNNFVNPTYAVHPPDPVTGQHGYDTRRQLGDFDLTLLPKNRNIRFNLGFSPERYSGPVFTNYHMGGDDFVLFSHARSRSNEFRLGADWRLGPVDFSLLQGFRRFRDDTTIDNNGVNLGINPALTNAYLTNIQRNQPTRGSVNYTRFSAHTLLAKKLDMTGRFIYSNATTNYVVDEFLTGINYNTRVTGVPTANTLTSGTFDFHGNAKRPNVLGDFGVTYLATDRLRFSNTFRVETFQINGASFYNLAFYLNRTNGTAVPPILVNGDLGTVKTTKYRKIQDTVEGDYQFNNRYSAHFGYRYGTRRTETFYAGYNPGVYVPALVTTEAETETNHTNAFFGGFKARPVKSWTVYFDAEHGTADNVFTRVGNYDYTNFRARSRYAPTQRLSFNVALITRNNSNPSEIDGVSLQDFGVDVKSRVFSSSVDWTVSSKLSFSGGYSHNRVDSDAAIDYYYNNVRHPNGHSLYFMRNHYFYFDVIARPLPRVSFYAAYRINKDTGQGSLREAPTAGLLIASYPMSYQSPEGRLSIRLNKRLEWNLGYQYYNYNESPLVSIRPQNYHAHQPYTSLRIYFGGGER